MRLVLELPAAWPIDGIELEVAPVIAMPRDVDKVVLTSLLREAPATIELAPPKLSTSARGWPLRVQEVTLLDAGTVRELRVLAAYGLVDWLGMAMIVARDLAAFAQHEQALRTLLASGEPDFRGERAASLWEALSDRPE